MKENTLMGYELEMEDIREERRTSNRTFHVHNGNRHFDQVQATSLDDAQGQVNTMFPGMIAVDPRSPALRSALLVGRTIAVHQEGGLMTGK